MRSIVFIASIFYATGLVALSKVPSSATQVTTEVIVNTVSHRNQLFNLVEKGTPVDLLAAILNNADVNTTENGKTLLQYAKQLGRNEMVKILLRHGADDSEAMLAQEEAVGVDLGTLTAIQALANKKNCDKELHLATLAGQVDKVRGLIAANHDVNSRDELGRTAAHHAAITGNLEIITTLAENNADMNIKDNAGNTPYTAAKLAAQEDIVAYLEPITEAAAIDAAELAERQAAALALRDANKTCARRAF